MNNLCRINLWKYTVSTDLWAEGLYHSEGVNLNKHYFHLYEHYFAMWVNELIYKQVNVWT